MKTAQVIKLVPRRNVGIWVRVSTEFQAQGDSPLHHEARARERAEDKGWEVAQVYHLEAVSGKSILWHSETQRMLQDIKSGVISGLIVSKFARLVRNTRELLEITGIFRTHNAELISLDEPIDTTTSSGRLFVTVMSGLAEWEREEIASRVSASVPIRAKLGKPLGGPAPFGYRWEEKKMLIDTKEAPIRKLMYELFLEHRRKKTVARLLNAAGYKTRNGGKFSDTTVDRLLRDSSAKGLRRANYTCSVSNKKAWILKPESKWVFVPIEPIVSEEIWSKANQLLDAQRSKLSRSGTKAVHLFSGAFCGCGKKMYKPSNTRKYVCYTCRRKIEPEMLESVFLSCVESMFTLSNVGSLFARAHAELLEKRSLLKSIAQARDERRDEMDRLYQLYISGEFDEKELGRFYRPLKAQLQQYEGEIATLEGEIAALEYRSASPAVTVDEVRKIVGKWWPEASSDARRSFVESFVRKMEVQSNSIIVSFHCLGKPPKLGDVDFGPLALLCGLEVSMPIVLPKARQPQTLGEHLKHRRLELKLTQKEAGQQIGAASDVTYLHWEKDQTDPPFESLPAIMAFIGYDPFPQPKDLPEQLLAKRRKAGWSIRQAAAKLGVDPGTWGGWERGETILFLKHRQAVSQLLDLSPEVLDQAMRTRWNNSHGVTLAVAAA